MVEEWRGVANYECLYHVSDQGRVKSLAGWRGVDTIGRNIVTKKERILKPSIDKPSKKHPGRGAYHRVYLTSNSTTKTYFIHRLVWEAFYGPIPSYMQIDHIDDDPGNNKLNNLQLLTRTENRQKAIARKNGIAYETNFTSMTSKQIHEYVQQERDKASAAGYLAGRKDAYKEGYEEGYRDCCKWMVKEFNIPPADIDAFLIRKFRAKFENKSY